MDFNQQNSEGDNASLPLTSSIPSTLESISTTTSLMRPKPSNINVDYSEIRPQSFRERYNQQQKQMKHYISSYSATTNTSVLSSTTTIMKKSENHQNLLNRIFQIQKQEAQPLGICVRKCGLCRQFKHILLAECTVCCRMMDVDLKDCKCRILRSRNIIDQLICSICNSELTLDGYIICANRTCQTTLSTLINKESTAEIEEISVPSAILTDIYYPKSIHRTVAIQVNTLIHLPSLQRFLPNIIDDVNKESSSSLSLSKCDLDSTKVTSAYSSDMSYMSIESNMNVSLDNVTRNMTAAFNSNQPTKLALQSEDKLRQQLSQLTNTNDKTVDNSVESIEMPKSPRCLAIMNVQNRHDRLSALLKLKQHSACQTKFSCLIDIDKMIRCDELANVTVVRTNSSTQIERQIQVDTIKERFYSLCQARVEMSNLLDSTIDATNDETILKALIDRDGQRWSEFIDHLINAKTNFSLINIAQRLLNTIERLHSSGRLNNLTNGQLQRKVRYAMSQLKCTDEYSSLRNDFKSTKINRSTVKSTGQTDCNGALDMTVTVRPIDQHHNRQQSVISSHPIWKPDVDRLFDQGHSADEIHRLIHEAATSTPSQCDDYRLQHVFNYIDAKAKQQRARTAPSKIAFVAASPKAKSITHKIFQSTTLFQTIKPTEIADGGNTGITACLSSSTAVNDFSLISDITGNEISSNNLLSAVKNNDWMFPIEATKNSFKLSDNLPHTGLIESSNIESNKIRKITTENKFIIDLSKNEKENNLPIRISSNQGYVNLMSNVDSTIMKKQPSLTNIETIIQNERNTDENIDSDNDNIINERKATQRSREVVNSKISQTSKTSAFHSQKNFSTTKMTASSHSTNVPLSSLEEQSSDRLQPVQSMLGTIYNSDVHKSSHSSNILLQLNPLVDIIESNLHESDKIRRDDMDLLMTKCIELLHNQNKANMSQSEKVRFQNVNDGISNTSNLLQEYTTLTIPSIIHNEDSLYEQNLSNMIILSSDIQASLKRVKDSPKQSIESIFQPIQSPPNAEMDLKQQMITSEHQEFASPIRCRGNAFNSSIEKISMETLKTVATHSKEYISLETEDLSRPLIKNKMNPNDISNIELKNESVLHHKSAQKEWLDSLLSKLFDNVSRTSNVSSTSPSLLVLDGTKVNDKDKQEIEQQEKQESIKMKPLDNEVSILREHSKSSISGHEHATNMMKMTVGSPNKQYVADVIILRKEYAMSIIIPDQSSSMINEHCQLVEAKISQKKLAISTKTLLNLKDQLTQLPNDKNHDVHSAFQKSPSANILHKNYFKEEKESNSFVVHDETSSVNGQPSLSSNIEVLEQLDQVQILDTKSTSKSNENVQSLQKLVDNETIKNASPKSVLEDKDVISFSSNDDTHKNVIRKNESNIYIEKNSKTSDIDVPTLNQNATLVMSEAYKQQNEISKVQLPVTTKYFAISDGIQQHECVLAHLNDPDGTHLLKKTISDDTHTSNEEKHSNINLHDQDTLGKTSIRNNNDIDLVDDKIDNRITDQLHTPTSLSLNPNITQQSIKSIMFPSNNTRINDVQYAKMSTSLIASIESTSISRAMSNALKENESMIMRTGSPHLIGESSETKSSLMKLTTEYDVHNDEHNHVNDNIPKSNQDDASNHKKDFPHNNPDPTLLYKEFSQELNLSDDTIQLLPSSIKNKENLLNETVNNQQPMIQFIQMDRTHSLPKVDIENIKNDSTLTKVKQLLKHEIQLTTNRNTEFLNASLPNTVDLEKRKELSSSNQIIINRTLENIAASKSSTLKNYKLQENSSLKSEFDIESSHRENDRQSEKIKPFENRNFDKQSLPVFNIPVSVNFDSETKNLIYEIPPSSLSKLHDANQDRLNDRKSTNTEERNSAKSFTSDVQRMDRSSVIKIRQQPIPSTTDAVLLSSFTNINMKQQVAQPWMSSSEIKDDRLTFGKTMNLVPEEIANLKRILPSNLVHRSSISSLSMPKLLLKRSSIKSNSTATQIIKPNAALSITDVSTSSSNIATNDRIRSTHSALGDQEEIISRKKSINSKNFKDKFMSAVQPSSKRNILRQRTLRSSHNQSLISSKPEERNLKSLKKKFMNNSLVSNSNLVYDSEQGSDTRIKSHENHNQILRTDQRDQKKKQKRPNKSKTIDSSQLAPFNLQARGDHQASTVDSSRLPNIEQSCGTHYLKKYSNYFSRRPIIRLPVTQIEKFECGTIGPRLHSSHVANRLLPSIDDRHYSSGQFHQTTESFTDRIYSLMSSENIDDKQAFESILNWQSQQQNPIRKVEQNKFQNIHLLDASTSHCVRGRQYPILADEIDMIDDPNTCTIVNEWAFAELVNAERDKFMQNSTDTIIKSKKRANINKNIKICLRKRPLTRFEQSMLKEVDIISIVNPQTIYLHIPSITVDNQVFIRNRKFKCDHTFDEYCQISTIYHSTLAPLLDLAIDSNNCLYLIGGGKYSGKNFLLHELIDRFAFDLNRLLSSYDIYIKLLGICHNRIIDLLQNYSPIRIIKSMNWTLIPNDVFHLKNDKDIDYVTCQIKRRRRFIHQIIQINFHEKHQSKVMGSLMIVVLASSQYVYTRNLCSHRRKVLINSLNKTILSFKRALIGNRQNPDRVRAAFNNDVLTRLIEPYVFDDQSNICYVGTLNPGHRHRTATKYTIDFARNLRFCLKRINKQRRQQKKIIRENINNHDDDLF
ncbi:unnamed protein product [Rotaria socialis]|uniref:Kinesin motor domain-containing protein n=1 Tax=Rotaria socialis TaxID=392032 RepID=A0A820ELL0_9BILA|nr:unnamed protein product [Rotaria socialis]